MGSIFPVLNRILRLFGNSLMPSGGRSGIRPLQQAEQVTVARKMETVTWRDTKVKAATAAEAVRQVKGKISDDFFNGMMRGIKNVLWCKGEDG